MFQHAPVKCLPPQHTTSTFTQVLGKLPIEMLDTFKIHLVGSGLPSDIKDDLSKYVKTHGYLSEDDIKAIFNR